MRFILPLAFLVGCTMESTLTGEEEILISALSGEEEVFSDHDIAARGMQPSEDMPKMFRECDAQGSFEKIFDRYDEDKSSELDEEEKEKVCDGRKDREATQQRRAKHMMELLKWVYDLDEDKELSDTEKEALYADFSERCEQIHQKLLAEFDADGDGVLSGEEQEAAKEEARLRYEEKGLERDHTGNLPHGLYPQSGRGTHLLTHPVLDQRALRRHVNIHETPQLRHTRSTTIALEPATADYIQCQGQIQRVRQERLQGQEHGQGQERLEGQVQRQEQGQGQEQIFFTDMLQLPLRQRMQRPQLPTTTLKQQHRHAP